MSIFFCLKNKYRYYIMCIEYLYNKYNELKEAFLFLCEYDLYRGTRWDDY